MTFGTKRDYGAVYHSHVIQTSEVKLCWSCDYDHLYLLLGICRESVVALRLKSNFNFIVYRYGNLVFSQKLRTKITVVINGNEQQQSIVKK